MDSRHSIYENTYTSSRQPAGRNAYEDERRYDTQHPHSVDSRHSIYENTYTSNTRTSQSGTQQEPSDRKRPYYGTAAYRKAVEDQGEKASRSSGGSRMTLLVVLVILVALLLVLGRFVLTRGGSDTEPAEGKSSGQAEEETEPGEDTSGDEEEAVPEDPSAVRLAYIRSNPDLYPEVLQQLAEEHEETIDYVYLYPTLKDVDQYIDLTNEAQSGSVPLLLQWDTRWGYVPYGDGLLGYTGSGPTSLSIAAIYLTGNPEYTPAAVAGYAEEQGYYVTDYGTSWTLISQGCTAFGLESREVSLSEEDMVSALEEGAVLICAMAEGDFTDTGGDFIVLSGWTDGGFSVRDPNSAANSAQTWTFDRLEGQISGIWALTALESEVPEEEPED